MQPRLVAAAAGAILRAAAVHAQAEEDPLQTWRRNHWGMESTSTVRDCLACHGRGELRAHAGHPVDVDYAEAAARPRNTLRSLSEALRRGVLLVDNRIHCYTCHDPRSRWLNHIAIPPGASPRTAVVIGLDMTYAKDRPPPVDGTEVSPTPLCQACHTYGD